MIANIGFGALFIALITALYGVAAAIYGERSRKAAWVDSARQAMALSFPLLTITVAALLYLLLTNHYEIAYVGEVSSRSMPVYLKMTALWGGQSGSLVFWSWLLAGFASAVTLGKWDRDREFLPWVIVVTLVTLAFFLILSVFFENPFARLWQLDREIVTSFFRPVGALPFVPRDGRGLNPLLRHPGMIIHPPMLYLGFVAFVIPYAFAIAALITGRTDDRWIQLTRRWTLWAWLFLSLGLVLGARWAYDVLGWGGYWGWDPVEISAFMPWLAGTAFLHSVMIQEKRGMFKQLNMVLIILTFDLVIFGTFLTRSGVLSSVHSFAQSAIGPLFFVFISATLAVSLGLLINRWNDLSSRNELKTFLSREALILFSVLLFMGILVTSFWGVIFPLISELVTGQKVTVGPPFYERATGPLFGGLLLLLGICPLSAWGYSSWKTLRKLVWLPFLISLAAAAAALAGGIRQWQAILAFWLVGFSFSVLIYELIRDALARGRRYEQNVFDSLWGLLKRNQRRYGAIVIHLGVVMMALGVIGIESFQTETQATIPEGGRMELASYTMTYQSLETFNTNDGRNVARAVVSVAKNGQLIDELYPRRDFFFDSNQQVTIPGVRSTLVDDLYIILIDWKAISQEGATFKVFHNPLVKWLWIGSWVFILGVVIAAWPERKSKKIRKSKPVPQGGMLS
ncbi:MAG: heme lyase CcmF/NrfE family subunit [Anaerolineales bacterium]|nr:heme lyase CcmF/NrfE family subunit [Anaerolineales bacterium]